MELTRISPSFMPDSERHFSTSGVMLINALLVDVSNQSSLRYDFMAYGGNVLYI